MREEIVAGCGSYDCSAWFMAGIPDSRHETRACSRSPGPIAVPPPHIIEEQVSSTSTMSNQVISLAIIGKNNEPLYLKEFAERNDRDHVVFDEAELFGLHSPKATEDTTGSSTTGNPAAAPVGNEAELDETFQALPISLKQQFILHSALDRFEQLSGPPPGYAWRRGNTAGDTHHPMYVGLLCPVEDSRVYGFMTTTQIKFFCVVMDDPSSNAHLSSASFSTYANSHDGTLPFQQSMKSSTTPNIAPNMSSLGINSPGHHHNLQPLGDQHVNTDILLQRLFVALHQCYVSLMLNPFSPMLKSSPIVSQRFDKQILEVVREHNQWCLAQK